MGWIWSQSPETTILRRERVVSLEAGAAKMALFRWYRARWPAFEVAASARIRLWTAMNVDLNQRLFGRYPLVLADSGGSSLVASQSVRLESNVTRSGRFWSWTGVGGGDGPGGESCPPWIVAAWGAWATWAGACGGGVGGGGAGCCADSSTFC